MRKIWMGGLLAVCVQTAPAQSLQSSARDDNYKVASLKEKSALAKGAKCAVAKKALDNFKARIRQLTGRSGGRSMAQVVEKLRPYLLGWKAYFELAQTPRVWRALDEWLRHRLRAIQLKHWKRGSTIYRELLALGATQSAAKRVADNSRCWWCNSRGALNTVLTIAYFDRLGVPRLS
jgi:RNA-directed DNA polymerase